MNNSSPTNQRRPNQASEIILSGRVWNAVWYLAWPTAINTLILTAYNVVNRVFLGRLHDATDSLAAVGIGGTALMMQFALTIGLSAGTAALVARFLGAQEYDDADEATRQSIILAVIAGALSSVPLILFATPVCGVIGAKGPVAPLAGDYTAIISWFSIPLFLYMTVITALRSAGDVRSPLYAGASMIALNILFDWLLIFGIGPFPAMGVRGAAVATGISRIAGTALMFWFLSRSELNESISHFRFHADLFRRIIRIGWPASIQNILWTAAYAGFVKILAFLPGGEATAAQAALTVAITIESTAFMPGVAYSSAATPLVGQNLGAGNPDRAAHSAWVATAQAAAIMSVAAVIFLSIPRQLALIFTSQAAVVSNIVTYLRINALAEPLLAVAIVLRGALQGAGETRAPAWITLITNWFVRLPLAWLLAITLRQGASGAWIAMSATTFISGLLMAGWFKRGTWRETRV